MKFLVRENQTGKMGTFDSRFVIPDLAAPDAALKISSVVWRSQREPLQASAGAAGKTTKRPALPTLLSQTARKWCPA